MSTSTRIYTVTNGDKQHLVRATHPSQAVSHVARSILTVRVASQTDLEALLPAGVQVEEAGKTDSNDEQEG